MAYRPQEHYWQFHLTDGVDHAAGNGAAEFERHSWHLADTLGCRLVTSKNVRLERLDARKFIVSGTVILAKGE